MENKTKTYKVQQSVVTKRGYYHNSMECFRAIKRNLKEGFAPVEVKNILRNIEGNKVPCVYVRYIALQCI